VLGLKAWMIPVLVAVVGVIAFLWGFEYVVPDLGLSKYGFPLIWGVNTTITIAGPVDRWSVDITALLIDISVWFSLILVSAYISRDVLK
jgi:hypothetical protein